MKFTLTVIIPNYNNANYLKKCINSVLYQSYQPDKIIIFDDCSTDNSLYILDEYVRKYSQIELIRSDCNVGVSSARHAAIMRANTTYVTMLDADDFYYRKDKLEKEMQTVEQYYFNTGKCGCAFSQVIIVNEDGREFYKPKMKRLEKLIRFRTVTRLYRTNTPRDFCFPKEAYIQAGGYNFECKLYEDWDLDLRLLKICDFLFSNNYGTAYRQKTNGLSHENYKVHFATKKEIFEKNENILNYSIFEKIVFYNTLYLAFFKGWLTKKLREKPENSVRFNISDE